MSQTSPTKNRCAAQGASVSLTWLDRDLAGIPLDELFDAPRVQSLHNCYASELARATPPAQRTTP